MGASAGNVVGCKNWIARTGQNGGSEKLMQKQPEENWQKGLYDEI